MLLNLSLSSLKLSYHRQLPPHQLYHYFFPLWSMWASPRKEYTQNEERLFGAFPVHPPLAVLFPNRNVANNVFSQPADPCHTS